MNIWTIVDRELRVASRRTWTYRMRLVTAAAAMYVLAMLWLISQKTGAFGGGGGNLVFTVLSWMVFIGCLIEGARATADCLSSEKREGTIGLLFLTRLRGMEVVLGKLAAQVLNALYGMAAVVPVLAVAFLMGGVTGGELGRIFLVLLATLLLSASVGLLVSSRSLHEHRALVASGMGLVLVCWGPYWIGVALGAPLMPSDGDLPYTVSPISAFARATAAVYPGAASEFWIGLVAMVGLSMVLLILAGWTTGRFWNRETSEAVPRRRRWSRFFTGGLATRQPEGQALLDRNPILWLASHRRLRFWAFVLPGILLPVGLMALVSFTSGNDYASIFTYQFLSLFAVVIKLVVCWYAAAALGEARKSGALELWLCTPLTVGQIIRGIYFSLRRLFYAVLAVVGAAAFIVFLPLLLGLEDVDSGPMGSYIFINVGRSVVVTLADVLTLGWVGMWYALTSKSVTSAVTRTYLMVIVVPWFAIQVGSSLLIGVVGFGMASAGGNPALMMALAQGLPIVLILIKDLGFYLWAKRRLQSRFRRVASEGTEEARTKRIRVPSEPPPLPAAGR